MVNRRVFLALLGASAGRAAPFWERRKFPNWSDREVDLLLSDSPWAKPLRVSFVLEQRRASQVFSASDVGLPAGVGFPGRVPGWPPGRLPQPGGAGRGGAQARAEAFLTLRWSSALPVRQALVLLSSRGNPPEPSGSEAALEQDPPDYLLELFGLPAQAAPSDTAGWAGALQQSAVLLRPQRQPIQAGSVEIPPYGNHLAIRFRFPRTEPIALEDRQVEFFAAGGPFEFRKIFKLAPMVYEGRLAL